MNETKRNEKEKNSMRTSREMRKRKSFSSASVRSRIIVDRSNGIAISIVRPIQIIRSYTSISMHTNYTATPMQRHSDGGRAKGRHSGERTRHEHTHREKNAEEEKQV